MVDRIYHTELQLSKASSANTEALLFYFIYLFISIGFETIYI